MQDTRYDETYIDLNYRRVDPDGRRYRLDNIQGPGGAAKGNPFYEVMGISRHWRYTEEIWTVLRPRSDYANASWCCARTVQEIS